MGFFDFTFGSSDVAQPDNFVDGSAIGNNIIDIPYVNSPLVSAPSLVPDGAFMIADRTNSSFWGFDQSQISASIQDVAGSILKAGVKSAIQGAGDLINRNANQPGALGGVFRNFQSTQTGAQIQAASIATRAQNFLANPMVWLGVVGVGLFLLLRK